MAAMGRLGFLATAVVFHLVYIYSIFDIYFVSPIVSGMQLVSVDRPTNIKSPADRLVLFVGTIVMAAFYACTFYSHGLELTPTR